MTDIDFDKLTELVVKYQDGDNKAFEQIYDMTYRTAKFTALKILNNNESDADDVLQDCYIKVMKKIGTLKNPSSFMGWFNMMIANQAKSVIRKNNPHFYEKSKNEDYSKLDDEWSKEFEDYNDTDKSEDYHDDSYDEERSIGQSKNINFLDETSTENYDEFLPGSDIEKEELCHTVMDMIDNLGEEKKTAVILYYYNKMTTREISESIGVSENTIKSRLLQAKKDLAKSVSAYEAKNGKLLGVSPASLIAWVLSHSATSVSVTPFAASGIVIAGTATAAGTAAAGTAAGTGIAAKIIAGVVIAGIVTGGVVGGARKMKGHNAYEATTTTTQKYTETVNDEAKNEENHTELITTRPIDEYTVPDNKAVDTYFETGTLKYGVEYSIQRFANKNGDEVELYSGRPVLNRKNFKASYEDLLPAAKENNKKYSTYITNAVSQINNKRVQNGMKALTIDSKLTEQANVRAEEIAWSGQFAHTRPNGSPFRRIFQENGLTTGTAGENIARGYDDPETVCAAWKASETHYANIMDESFVCVGIGVAIDPLPENKLVFVQHFYTENV